MNSIDSSLLAKHSGQKIIIEPCSSLPELNLIGKTEIKKVLPKLDIPSDPRGINLYFGYKGSKEMLCEGKTYSLSGGEFFLTPPGVSHSTGPMPLSKCAHYWLRISTSPNSSTFFEDPSLKQLFQEWSNIKSVHHGRYGEALFDLLRSIYDLSTQDSSPMRDLELRMQLSLFLIKLLRQIDQHLLDQQQTSLPMTLAKVKAYLLEHLGEDLSVKDMANVIHCSSSNLSALFSKNEGTSPAEYFTRLKMKEAHRLLLESTHNLKEISQQLGYSNERYFSMVFKNYYHSAPGRYRKANALS